jgi:hypothetical protein
VAVIVGYRVKWKGTPGITELIMALASGRPSISLKYALVN